MINSSEIYAANYYFCGDIFKNYPWKKVAKLADHPNTHNGYQLQWNAWTTLLLWLWSLKNWVQIRSLPHIHWMTANKKSGAWLEINSKPCPSHRGVVLEDSSKIFDTLSLLFGLHCQILKICETLTKIRISGMLEAAARLHYLKEKWLNSWERQFTFPRKETFFSYKKKKS